MLIFVCEIHMEIFVRYDKIVQQDRKSAVGRPLIILSVSEGSQLYGGSTGDVTPLKQSLEGKNKGTPARGVPLGRIVSFLSTINSPQRIEIKKDIMRNKSKRWNE
jgi:hypothetical protein